VLCDQDLVPLVKARLEQIAAEGRVFVAGGVGPDGVFRPGRVQLAVIQLEKMEEQMRQWAQQGPTSRSFRISIALNC